MFPAAFDYAAPATLVDALALLKQHGDDAKIMAGGQSLIPMLKLRFARPGIVVDIGRLPATDPVCGMTVDPLTATHKAEFGGKTFWFCSAGCQVEFEKTPERYLRPIEA